MHNFFRFVHNKNCMDGFYAKGDRTMTKKRVILSALLVALMLLFPACGTDRNKNADNGTGITSSDSAAEKATDDAKDTTDQVGDGVADGTKDVTDRAGDVVDGLQTV